MKRIFFIFAVITLVSFSINPVNAQDEYEDLSEDIESSSTGDDSLQEDSVMEEDSATIGDFVDIKWEEPQLSPRKLKYKSLKLVLISGMTRPGSEVSLSQDTVLTYYNSGKSRLYKISARDKALLPVKADNSGRFIMQLILPRRVVQIPVQVKAPNGAISKTIFSFKVTNRKVYVIQANQFDATMAELKRRYYKRKGLPVPTEGDSTPVAQDKSPSGKEMTADDAIKVMEQEQVEVVKKTTITSKSFTPKTFSLGLGTGMSYVSFTEEIESVNADLDFASFEFLSLHGDLQFKLGNIFLEGGGSLLPGTAEAEDGSSLVVRESEFSWIRGYGRVSYQPEALKFGLGTLGFGASFHYQSLPFLTRVSTNVVEVEANGVGFIGFGARIASPWENKFSYALHVEYLYPILSGEIFTIDSALSFAGGLEVQYRFSDLIALGFNWYGQYVDFEVVQEESGVSRDTSLNLLNSTIDLRLKFFF